jgi:drug/metabolite transporter (DMT)-like permease
VIRAGAPGLVAAAACFGSLAVTTTIALRGFGPWTLLAGELAIAVAVLGIATLATGQRLPRLSVRVAALGLLEPGISYLTFNLGVQRTSSSHAGLLLGLETVFVVGLSMLLLAERPRAGALAGVALAVAGVAVLSWHPGGGATLLGDALVLLDVLCASLAVILTARLVRDIPALPLTTLQFAAGLVLVLPFAFGAWVSGAEAPLGTAHAGPLLALVITGSVGTAGGFLLYNSALTKVSATSAAAGVTLIPLFGLGLSKVFLGEAFTWGTAVAAALILAGLLSYIRSTRDTSSATEPSKAGDRREILACLQF